MKAICCQLQQLRFSTGLGDGARGYKAYRNCEEHEKTPEVSLQYP